MLMNDKAWKLAQDYGGIWGEHPELKIKNWQLDIEFGRTRDSYWNWVIETIEHNEEEEVRK